MVDKKAREMGVESLALLVMLVAVAVAARAPFEEEGPGSGERESIRKSCVKTFLPMSENHSQNVRLPTPKMHYRAQPFPKPEGMF